MQKKSSAAILAWAGSYLKKIEPYMHRSLPKTAVIVVFGSAMSGPLSWKIAGWAGLASLFWQANYIKNEVYDSKFEPGKASKYPTLALPICEAILIAVPLLTLCANWRIGLLFLLMATTQHLYCHPKPFGRLKRYWLAYMLFSGILNPSARFLMGAIANENPATDWPFVWIALGICAVATHFGLSFKTRAVKAGRDEGLGYQTVPKWLAEKVQPLQFLTPLGLAGFCWCCETAELKGFTPNNWTFLATTLYANFALAGWSINDEYDQAMRNSHSAPSPELVNGCWKGKFPRLNVQFASYVNYVMLGMWFWGSPTIATFTVCLMLLLYRAGTYNDS